MGYHFGLFDPRMRTAPPPGLFEPTLKPALIPRTKHQETMEEGDGWLEECMDDSLPNDITARHSHDQPDASKGHQEDSPEDISDRPSKRARTNASNHSALPKKRVKGKQGGLQGIMKMPIEVFMEIAPYVNPGDLITLIRTNKFFRSMLLHRSATPIWQCALNNMPNLPPCPTGMVEPQYAALMFTKNCTICGVLVVASKPDPYLRVRLCPNCRATELVEQLRNFYLVNFEAVPFTLIRNKDMHKAKKGKKSSSNNTVHQLRSQVQEYENKRNEFIRNHDSEGRVKWEEERLMAWTTQRKEGDEILKYIQSVAESRSIKLRDLKGERREEIHDRLIALGWEEKYFDFWGGADNTRRQWHSLVDVPKPLTERTWTNVLPKLTQLLEVNRPRVDELERQQRLNRRRAKVEGLLSELKAQIDPYRPIINALRQDTTSTGSTTLFSNTVELPAPFPSGRTLAGWDLLANLYKEECSPERVGELLNERRDLVVQKLSEWRAKVEDQLVKQYLSSSGQSLDSLLDTPLTVKGSTDATMDLSDTTRFLLRADTVFMESDELTCDAEVDQEHGPIALDLHFPNISPVQNHGYPYIYSSGLDPDEETTQLEPYVRHAGKETIVKALLKELDMPDASHVELVIMGKVFVCGRCNRSGTMEWRELITHYHMRSRDWVGGKYVCNNLTTKHPVIMRNMHATTPGTSSQPLVRIGTDTHDDWVARCLICHKLERYERFESMEMMRVHMAEVHDATELVEDLHFITGSRFSDMLLGHMNPLGSRADWERKWDEYHDAHSMVDE